MATADEVSAQLKRIGTPDRAKASAWYFKSGPGQYGEGDVFAGVPVPEQRKVARQFRGLPLQEIDHLLASPVHEERLTALIILVDEFKRADDAGKQAIYDFYLAHTTRINNWDLVDSSAPYIVGKWLEDRDRLVLLKLAKSDLLWERRIAMIATLEFVRGGDPGDALKVAEILVHDKHDLIHKAVGWTLREIGQRCSQEAEEAFLRKHYQTMPRTMLRYAIEKFPPDLRQAYLQGKA